MIGALASSRILTMLSVLTFNVWGLPDMLAPMTPARTERMAAICETLKDASERPDGWKVILLQEVWTMEDRETLKHCGYPYSADLDEDTHLGDSGLLILSGYPIEEGSVRRLVFKEGGKITRALIDGEYLANKSGLIARILHPIAGPIWAANTHLISVYDAADDVYRETRQAQFREFLSWARAVSWGEPLLIGGDWNFGPDSDLWRETSDAREGLSQLLPLKGFCTFAPTKIDEDLTSCQFDHLLGSERVRATTARAVFDQFIEVDQERLRVSDHLGWETVFEIQTQGAASDKWWNDLPTALDRSSRHFSGAPAQHGNRERVPMRPLGLGRPGTPDQSHGGTT